MPVAADGVRDPAQVGLPGGDELGELRVARSEGRSSQALARGVLPARVASGAARTSAPKSRAGRRDHVELAVDHAPGHERSRRRPRRPGAPRPGRRAAAGRRSRRAGGRRCAARIVAARARDNRSPSPVRRSWCRPAVVAAGPRCRPRRRPSRRSSPRPCWAAPSRACRRLVGSVGPGARLLVAPRTSPGCRATGLRRGVAHRVLDASSTDHRPRVGEHQPSTSSGRGLAVASLARQRWASPCRSQRCRSRSRRSVRVDGAVAGRALRRDGRVAPQAGRRRGGADAVPRRSATAAARTPAVATPAA